MAHSNGKYGKKLSEVDVNAIEKLYAEGCTAKMVMERWGLSDTTVYQLFNGKHAIQLAREARKKAQAKSSPCPGCGRPLVPPCRFCAMIGSAAKTKTLADEATLKARAARAKG